MLWILHYVSLCFQVMDSTLLQETGTELNLSHRSEKPELNKSVFFPTTTSITILGYGVCSEGKRFFQQVLLLTLSQLSRQLDINKKERLRVNTLDRSLLLGHLV